MSKKKSKGKHGKSGRAKKQAAPPTPAETIEAPVAPEETVAPTESTKAEKPKIDFDALKIPIQEAQAKLEAAQAEAKDLEQKARNVVSDARALYLSALAPYREACRKAHVPCEFSGGRSPNRTERVIFEIEKKEGGIRVMVQGRPETEEVIPLEVVKESIGKAAYGYTDKHLGTKEEVGNKGGSLTNRLRAVLNA